MRWLAILMLVMLVGGCTSNSGGTVQGGGSDHGSQGRVGFHLPL
jgi:hypothetical protein